MSDKSESFNVARIKKGSSLFEIVVDPDLAIAYKESGSGELRDVLKYEEIFSDAKKGMVVPETLMKDFFKTDDKLKIAETIIKQGEIQLTSEYREKKREEKRKKIINIIVRNGVDPRSHLPHPPQRIENAFAEVKVKIDEIQSAEEQIDSILKKIRVVLPIKFEIKEIALKIPADYAAKSYSAVTKFSKIIREEWLTDGSWVVVVEIPGGLENDLYDGLNSVCHGNIESKVLKSKG